MAKKETVQTAPLTATSAMQEAKELIASLLPDTPSGEYVFKLKTGVAWMFPPKFTYYSKQNNSRVNVRYVATENSIFEVEQSGDDVLLEQIELSQHLVVRDKLLASWLVLNPHFGKKYTVFDPIGDAEKEYQSIEQFDEVWSEVRNKTDEQKRTLAVRCSNKSMTEVNKMTEKQLSLLLRSECVANAKRVSDFMNDPLMETLYLVSMADALKEIKYNKATGGLCWSSNGREICKIPAGKDPIMYLAKMLLEDQYLNVREELDKLTNG